MSKNKKNEELQSRREFFKKAAKGALPILGFAIMVNVPTISNATQVMDCNSSCSGACAGGCMGTCSSTCTGSCSGSCTGTCSGSCAVTCLSSSAK